MLFHLAPAQRLALAGRIELTLFPGGYAGLQPIKGNRANLCIVVRRDRFAELGRTWPTLLQTITGETPSLAIRLREGAPEWEKPRTPSPGYPMGWWVREATGDGLWRLGDRAAVIPSFSGDGMSIALHSARLAATAYLAGKSAATFQARLTRDLSSRIARSHALSRVFVHRRP